MDNLNLLVRENGKLHFMREPLTELLTNAFNQCQSKRDFEFLKDNVEGAIDVAFILNEDRWEDIEDD